MRRDGEIVGQAVFEMACLFRLEPSELGRVHQALSALTLLTVCLCDPTETALGIHDALCNVEFRPDVEELCRLIDRLGWDGRA